MKLMAVLNLLADTAGMNDPQYVAYTVLTTICVIVMFLAALAAIILILFQQSNSEGIQGITASSETFFGKNKGKSIESKLKKWSWICLIVMAVISIAFYIVQIMIV